MFQVLLSTIVAQQVELSPVVLTQSEAVSGPIPGKPGPIVTLFELETPSNRNELPEIPSEERETPEEAGVP